MGRGSGRTRQQRQACWLAVIRAACYTGTQGLLGLPAAKLMQGIPAGQVAPVWYHHSLSPPESVLQWRRSSEVRCLRAAAREESITYDAGSSIVYATSSQAERSCSIGASRECKLLCANTLHRRVLPVPACVRHTRHSLLALHIPQNITRFRVEPHLQVSATRATAASALYSRPRSSSWRSWPHRCSRAHTEPSASTNKAGVETRHDVAVQRWGLLPCAAAVHHC